MQDWVRGVALICPLRIRAQFLQLQFHWGNPPPAPEPKTRMRMNVALFTTDLTTHYGQRNRPIPSEVETCSQRPSRSGETACPGCHRLMLRPGVQSEGAAGAWRLSSPPEQPLASTIVYVHRDLEAEAEVTVRWFGPFHLSSSPSRLKRRYHVARKHTPAAGNCQTKSSHIRIKTKIPIPRHGGNSRIPRQRTGYLIE